MNEVIIEQRKIMKASCYRWTKYRYKDEKMAKCPWGYTEINPMCQNCIWFSVGKVAAEKRALVFDRKIEVRQIPQILGEWSELSKVSEAAPMDIETSREEMK